MFAQVQASQTQDFQYIVCLQAERDFQLHEDDVVIQLLFRWRLCAFLLAAFFNDQAVQKSGEIRIPACPVGGDVFFFQPIAVCYPTIALPVLPCSFWMLGELAMVRK